MSKKRKPTADPKVYNTLSKEAYIDNDSIPLKTYGFRLDYSLSDKETKVFVNYELKKVVVSYRGTKVMKDIGSDLAIATGTESFNPRFKGALKKFDQIYAKYGNEYTIDTTGHSLGGQLATYVNRHRPGQVNENLSYARGSGVGELVHSRPSNTYDYSNSKDIVSFGARMNPSESHPWYVNAFNAMSKTPFRLALDVAYNNFIGPSRSFIRNDLSMNPLEAHALENLTFV